VNETFVSQHWRLQPSELDSVLSRLGATYRAAGGDQIVVRDCFFCEKHGQPISGKPTNQHKLYFSRDHGAYYCQRCKAKGSWYDFKKEMGLLPVVSHFSGQEGYKTPDQNVVKSYPVALQLYPDVFEYLTKTRKINKEIIELYKVGAALYSFDDNGEWIEHECVTFPWIESYNGNEFTVRVKARSLSRKDFMRLEPTGGAWGFFGMHTVSPDTEQIVITEGEYDAMSVRQETGMAAVSLPNGSNSLPPELIAQLERFKEIYLWLDDDVPGIDGSLAFAEKLGIHRCKIVHTKLGDPDGPKDANDALKMGKDLKQILMSAKPVLHKEIMELNDIKQEVVAELLNHEQTLGIPFDDFPELTRIVGGFRKGELTVFTGPTGAGKCLGKNEPVLMYDGTIKSVQDIKRGDKLMGPDSKPRTVQGTTKGHGPLYRINPVKGRSWVCNDVHVLTLKNTSTKKVIDIPLNEYIEKSNNFKHLHKQFQVNVNFKNKNKFPLDPYYCGLWIADGSCGFPMIWKPDIEVENYVKKIANDWSEFGAAYVKRNDKREHGCPGHGIVFGRARRINPIYDRLTEFLNKKNEKSIPSKYLTTSRSERLEFLAGYLDGDGHLSGGGFEYTSEHFHLADQIAFIARSLGFKVTESSKKVNGKNYARYFISGDCSQIPTKIKRKKAEPRRQIKDVLVTGFAVESIGYGDYYGFELDGDGRFLLGDFTVTHNTSVIRQISLGLSLRGIRHCWGSFEIKNKKLVKAMFNSYCGKGMHRAPHEIDRKWNDFIQLPIWLMKFFGSTNVDQMLEAMEYCVYALDIEHFVIDNLQFMTSMQAKGSFKFDLQDEVIDKLRKFATNRNVHITLVAHPKKISEMMEMDVSSVAGTGKAGQEADNVWILQKGPYYRYIDVRKNRETGDLGQVPYEYDKEMYRFKQLSEADVQQRKADGSGETSGESHGLVSQIGRQRLTRRLNHAPPKEPPMDLSKVKNYAKDIPVFRGAKDD